MLSHCFGFGCWEEAPHYYVYCFTLIILHFSIRVVRLNIICEMSLNTTLRCSKTSAIFISILNINKKRVKRKWNLPTLAIVQMVMELPHLAKTKSSTANCQNLQYVSSSVYILLIYLQKKKEIKRK